jgi:hypothetical protein
MAKPVGRAWLGLAVASMFTLLGCSGAPKTGPETRAPSESPPTEPPGAPSSNSTPAAGIRQPVDSGPTHAAGYGTLEEYLASLAQMYEITDPPVVEVDREVRPEDLPALVVGCLEQQGFTASISGDGRSWGAEFRSEQKEAWALAEYICQAKYPPQPVFYQPYDEATLARIHSFFVTTSIPCLRDAGLDVSDPPTLATFVDSYRSQGILLVPWRDLDYADAQACAELPNDVISPRP